jgi:hypothetical protein
MKAHTHQEPSSIRSRPTPLPRSATRARRLPTFPKSTYKTQTKCRQNRECEFFSASAVSTYNFNAVKCLNFRSPERFPLHGGEGPSERQTGFFGSSHSRCGSFSLGEKVRMRDRLVIFGLLASHIDSLSELYSENRIKPNKTE